MGVTTVSLPVAALVEWHWWKQRDVDRFEVWRGEDNDPANARRIAVTTATAFVDLAMDRGVRYYYFVRAVDLAQCDSIFQGIGSIVI